MVPSRLRHARFGVRRIALAALTAALVALLAIPLLATPASAAPTATVVISEVITPPAVSVDAGGTVTFVNSIPARTDLLGVTLATDVTLNVPSGAHVIPSGASWSEVFNSSCLTCTVTYTYRVTAGILPPLTALPGLPASLPMVVNTIAPLPNPPVPPVNIPTPPAPTLPLPSEPGLPPAPGPEGAPSTGPTAPGAPPAGSPTPGTPTGGTNNTGTTVGEQIMPSAGGPLILGAPNGFEDLRRGGAGGSTGTSGGSGTGVGGYDGAQAPIFGVLDGLDGSPSGGNTGVVPAAVEAADTVPSALGTPALLAVLLLSVVSAGLVRTTLLSRRTK